MERSRAGLVRKEIVLADGTRIAYLDGTAARRWCWCTASAPTRTTNFTRIARYLVLPLPGDRARPGRLRRIVAPARRGLPLRAQAERLHAFVEALGLARVDLGGNSMGGGIAMSFAAQHPRSVASLWLIDCAGIAEAPPSELARIIMSTGTNPLMITKESDFPAFLKFVMSDPPWIPGSVMDVLARERIANQELERKVFQQIATDSVSGAVKGLPTPTLIVWGDEDRALSVGTVPVLETLLPDAQAVVMPNVGHAPMIERPQATAEDYIRFRETLAPAASN